MLTRQSLSVLDAAQTCLAAGVSNQQVDYALQHSIVCTLVPVASAALCLFERRIWLAVAVLPSLLQLTRALDVVCAALPSVAEAERTLRSDEVVQRVAQAEADRQAAHVMRVSTLTASIHPLLDSLKTLAAVGGRLSSILVSGVPEMDEEERLDASLKSRVFSAGMETPFTVDLHASNLTPAQAACVSRAIDDPDARAIPSWEDAMSSLFAEADAKLAARAAARAGAPAAPPPPTYESVVAASPPAVKGAAPPPVPPPRTTMIRAGSTGTTPVTPAAPSWRRGAQRRFDGETGRFRGPRGLA